MVSGILSSPISWHKFRSTKAKAEDRLFLLISWSDLRVSIIFEFDDEISSAMVFWIRLAKDLC